MLICILFENSPTPKPYLGKNGHLLDFEKLIIKLKNFKISVFFI